MFQISSGEGICLHFCNTASIHAAAQQSSHDQTNAGLSLTAPAGNDEHLLSLCGGNQAVAYEFLERQNVARREKLVQERQPPRRRWGVWYIAHQQAVDTEVLFRGECAVQEQRPVGDVYPVLIDWQRRRPAFYSQSVQQILNLSRHP